MKITSHTCPKCGKPGAVKTAQGVKCIHCDKPREPTNYEAERAVRLEKPTPN